MKVFVRLCFVVASGSFAGAAFGQAPVASYDFLGNFDPFQAGAPDLTQIGTGFFSSQTVFGMPTTVYTTTGSPGLGNQSYLTLDPSTVLSSGTDYTMQMVISKDSPVSDAWLAVLNTNNLAQDEGLYYNPSDFLEIYPTSTGGPNVDYGSFYNIVVTVSGLDETVYLDGSAIFSDSSGVMDLGAGDVLSFFADDAASGSIEYSNTTVSYLALYNSALDAGQVANLPVKDQFTSVPGPVAVMPFLIGLLRRRR